jgi:hypothetical protein
MELENSEDLVRAEILAILDRSSRTRRGARELVERFQPDLSALAGALTVAGPP